MNNIRRSGLVVAAFANALLVSSAYAQVPKPGENPTPGFNNEIPEKLLTPDKVESPIGSLY